MTNPLILNRRKQFMMKSHRRIPRRLVTLYPKAHHSH